MTDEVKVADQGDHPPALAAAPGGPVFVAAISRWSPRLDGILRQRIDRESPVTAGAIATVEETGQLPPLAGPGTFTAYQHRPEQLRQEITDAGLEVLDLVSVEGPAFLLDDLGDRLSDEESRRVLMETARALERVPELVGIGPHLLATARATGGRGR